jgi:hypothetical protein
MAKGQDLFLAWRLNDCHAEAPGATGGVDPQVCYASGLRKRLAAPIIPSHPSNDEPTT